MAENGKFNLENLNQHDYLLIRDEYLAWKDWLVYSKRANLLKFAITIISYSAIAGSGVAFSQGYWQALCIDPFIVIGAVSLLGKN